MTASRCFATLSMTSCHAAHLGATPSLAWFVGSGWKDRANTRFALTPPPGAHKNSRRRPTFPHSCPCSIIGAERLNCRVRNGNGCLPLAKTTVKPVRTSQRGAGKSERGINDIPRSTRRTDQRLSPLFRAPRSHFHLGMRPENYIKEENEFRINS